MCRLEPRPRTAAIATDVTEQPVGAIDGSGTENISGRPPPSGSLITNTSRRLCRSPRSSSPDPTGRPESKSRPAAGGGPPADLVATIVGAVGQFMDSRFGHDLAAQPPGVRAEIVNQRPPTAPSVGHGRRHGEDPLQPFEDERRRELARDHGWTASDAAGRRGHPRSLGVEPRRRPLGEGHPDGRLTA